MICPHCGQENPDDVDNCGSCGGSLLHTPEQPLMETPSVEPSQDLEPSPMETPSVEPLQDLEPAPMETPSVELSPDLEPAPMESPSVEPSPDLEPIPMETPSVEPSQDLEPVPMETQEPQMAPIPAASSALGGIYGNKVWWIIGCVVFICFILGSIALGVGLYRYTGLSRLLNPPTGTAIGDNSLVPTGTPLPAQLHLETYTPTTVSDIPLQPTPTITAIAISSTPTQVFFDDFSNPNSGWDRVDDTSYSANYFQGAYRILVNEKMSDGWANPEGHSFNDVIIDVDATKNGGSDDNDFGVICRYQGTAQYYYGVISSDGYYAIIKVTLDSSAILGHDQLQYSDLINQGFSTNHIRFDCIGNVLSLYVNDQLLDRQTDGEYTSGNVGLIAGTYNTPGIDILFDNFRVSSP